MMESEMCSCVCAAICETSMVVCAVGKSRPCGAQAGQITICSLCGPLRLMRPLLLSATAFQPVGKFSEKPIGSRCTVQPAKSFSCGNPEAWPKPWHDTRLHPATARATRVSAESRRMALPGKLQMEELCSIVHHQTPLGILLQAILP